MPDLGGSLNGFRGATAVVTGGASGIGAAIGEALRAEGAAVHSIDLDGSPPVDVRSADAVEKALEGLTVDILVCSAGVSVAGRFDRVRSDDLRWLMEVNLFGVVNTVRAALPRMQHGAHILLVSSSFAWLGFPGKSAYSASKAAVSALGESLRLELASSGIGVSVLYPGPVDTQLLQRGRATDDAQKQAEIAFVRRRAVDPSRVARAALHGIRRNRARIIVGWDYRLLDWLTRLSPSLALRVVASLQARFPF